MAVKLSAAEVTAMAPDAAGAAAGRKLGKAAPWKGLGVSERAFWGECQGSALYQTRVSVRDWSTKCSCPSRKFPCKHALGLLFLMAESPAAFASGAEPEWVTDWLDKKQVAEQKKQARAEQPEKPVDAAAQAKRANKRHATVLSGLDHLDLWLADLLRGGLGRLPSEGPALFDAEARRLVDAQAPGLARRLRAVGARIGATEDWAARVLGELGRVSLLSHAYRRQEALTPLLAHDVRRRIGYTLEQSEVMSHGDFVEDDWLVVACVTDEDERVRSQRAWLVGERSGRHALVLQFAAGPTQFAEVLLVGTTLPARLAFWPASDPQRALLAARLGDTRIAAAPRHGQDVAGVLHRHALALGRDPWLERSLFLLDGVTAVPGEPWLLVDRAGLALPLRGTHHEVLWAVSGGHPLTVAAEWNGFELEPLAAFDDGRAVALVREAAE